jgi:glycosyltransferase involved in cell wall biosynthesis
VNGVQPGSSGATATQTPDVADSERRAATARRPLRIGLNLLFMGERAGGAGRYASELPGALLAAEPDSELHLFVSRRAPAELRRAPWAQRVRWVTLPLDPGGSPLQLLAQFAGLPALARARRLDVLHSPANTGPVLTPGVASVVTLLDLIWLHRPAEWEADTRAHAAMRRQVGYCLPRADRVFAISRDAAEDFVRTLHVSRERIEVTPLGVRVERDDGRVPDTQALRERLDLAGRRVVLCVAQLRPYKNLARLVEALGGLDPDVALVLAGAPNEHERELRALAQRLGVGARVRFPGWLADAELQALYALADVFALPSLIEGFGIPVLEAMARGVPVACSNVSALPEVAGDAALLFDPQRQEEVTGALRRLLADPALAARLVARGHERVREFSWRRTAETSLAGYRRAIAARATR